MYYLDPATEAIEHDCPRRRVGVPLGVLRDVRDEYVTIEAAARGVGPLLANTAAKLLI